MKKHFKTFAVIIIASGLLVGCGKKASDYDHLIKEYKKTACTGLDSHSSMTEKSKALQRQSELAIEYQEALESLSDKEQAKLIKAMGNAMAEIADGKCD